jgi:hypothetical protein
MDLIKISFKSNSFYVTATELVTYQLISVDMIKSPIDVSVGLHRFKYVIKVDIAIHIAQALTSNVEIIHMISQ